MIVFVLWMFILETKWKNEFNVSFKIKTAISLWYTNVKEVFTVSPGLIELWGLYPRTFERLIVSLQADMDISSVTLREQKRSRSDFYSQQSCASGNKKQEQEVLLSNVSIKKSPVIRVFSFDFPSIPFSLFSVMLCLSCQHKHSFIHAFHKSWSYMHLLSVYCTGSRVGLSVLGRKCFFQFTLRLELVLDHFDNLNR